MDEATKVLEVYGAIEACKPANAVSAQNPAGSVWAKFAFWADSRDALRVSYLSFLTGSRKPS